MAKPKCWRTRCFLPKIHPKQYPEDLVTVRVQFRKSPGLSWMAVAKLMLTVDWFGIFFTPAMSTKEDECLTASFRLRRSEVERSGGRTKTEAGVEIVSADDTVSRNSSQ